MKIIESKIELYESVDWIDLQKTMEKCGRICYMSFEKENDTSYERFIRMIIKNGHESVFRHSKITFMITCPRDVSHQHVRHTMGVGISQQSQRYCDASKLEVIKPFEMVKPSMSYQQWQCAMESAEDSYRALIHKGEKKEVARSVLPNSTATRIAWTANFQAIRHYLKERGALVAQSDIRYLAIELYKIIKEKAPILVCDFELKEKEGREGYSLFLEKVAI